VEEIVDDLLGEVEKIVESEWGFLVKDHRLTFLACADNVNKRRLNQHKYTVVVPFFQRRKALFVYYKKITKQSYACDDYFNCFIVTCINSFIFGISVINSSL